MKLILSLSLLLASSLAFATPAVGDFALFNLKMEQNGAYMLGQFEISLLSQDSTGNYKMRTVVTMEDEPAQVRESVEQPKGFLSETTIQSVLSNCAAYGGKSSQFTITSETNAQTVPTCIIQQADDQGKPTGEIHVAAVAFGFVKQVEVDASTGRTVTLEMKAFAKGH